MTDIQWGVDARTGVPQEAGPVRSACMARPPVCPDVIGLLDVSRDSRRDPVLFPRGI